MNMPTLYQKRIPIPQSLCTQTEWQNQTIKFGGDIRVGDLTGNGRADFLVYRCDAQSELKPCFLAAFTESGDVLWQVGSGGNQPLRPASVTLYDINGDGCDEVICFYHCPQKGTPKEAMTDVVFQIRNGQTGQIITEKNPAAIQNATGWGPNWCHQRLLIANLRGTPYAQDLVIKLGEKLLTFDNHLNLLWQYTIPWNTYSQCSAYITAIGDLNNDGLDEINGGYYILNANGTPRWEKQLAPNMDSVAIVNWDANTPRAICSGGGHVLDQDGEVILSLGENKVPHGQEVRVGHFLSDRAHPQMAIRYNGHNPDLLIADQKGNIIQNFSLNHSPNETGMEVIHWNGGIDLIYNGGTLFDGCGNAYPLPNLPPPIGPEKMGWYHCIPGNFCQDHHDDLLIYNPWATEIFIYTTQLDAKRSFHGFKNTSRQYNARLMD
jgi:hypothetical protein